MSGRRATRASSMQSTIPKSNGASNASQASKRKRAVAVKEEVMESQEAHTSEDDHPMQTSRTRKGALRSASTIATRINKARVVSGGSNNTNDDSEDLPSPPKRTKKVSTGEQSPVELSDGEPEKPKRRGSAKPPSKTQGRIPSRRTKPVEVIEETQEDEVEHGTSDVDSVKGKTVGRRTGKKSSRSSARSSGDSKQPGKKAAQEKGDVNEGDESITISGTSDLSGSSQDQAGKTAEEAPVHVEDDTTTLLEPTHTTPVNSVQPTAEVVQGPKSRLVIHKLVLVNFKSYAGRQVIGPFHKSFSAIVGPNGSGKSNTIDSLLFVFGYRASKMRQGKLSELIHNSARYPDLDECSVEVHFREIIDLPGPDAFEVVPHSQLVVARIAYKSNSSKYTINAQTSTFTDVQTLLKGKGIDLDHKRFLILQGEVESIAQMKPKAPSEHEDGLLEYLEDIVGTSKYKEPIEEALIEVDKFGEERSEKLNRLRIVEKEKNALEDKKHEAENYLKLQNEHTRALSKLYQWYLWKCFVSDEEYSTNIEQLEQELADEIERNKDDIAHCQELEKHYEERGQLYGKLKADAAVAVKGLAGHEKQQVSLEERKKHASSKNKKLKKSLHENENAKAEALRFIDTNTDKIEKEQGKVVEYEESLDKEEKVLERIQDSLKDKTKVFQDEIEMKQKELQPWTAKINAKQAEIDTAVSERDALAKRVESAEAAQKEAKEALIKLKQEHEAKVTELEEVKGSKTDIQKEVRTNEEKMLGMRNTVELLRSKASSTRQKAEETRASQVASTSQNKVLDSLTRLRDTGRISGFYGRLGSLGTIADKYDVAISTACPGLHNLVVDKVDQGQACIEYLRAQNIGRASFIILDKLSGSDGLAKIATPENVPRLFDLVTPKDPRFAPAFFKAIGNTLVAGDLEQANRIAFGAQRRWRVVTLGGQLIDTSGTMSGGGSQPAKGAMSSKLAPDAVSPEMLKRYEKESEDAARELDSMLSEMRGLEATYDGLKRKVPQVDIALQKIELDIQTTAKRISEAEKRVRDSKPQSKRDESEATRIAALEDEISSATEELEQVQKESSEIQQAIRALEKKILDIGGAKLLTQKSKVDGIRLHINLAMEEITKAEVNKAKAEKDSRKFQKAVETETAALEAVQAELEELEEQLVECNQFVAEFQSKVEAAQSAADNAKEDLETLKGELDEKTERIQKFRQKEMEIKQQLDDVTKASRDNDKAIEHYKGEHDKLKLEEIDDEEDEDENENDEAVPAEQPEPEENVKQEMDGETEQEPKTHEKTSSYELYVFTMEELSHFRKRDMLGSVSILEERLKSANPNLGALQEYRKREQEFLNRAKDLEQITSLRDVHKQKYDTLRKQRLDEFMTGFNAISAKLKEMYQMITLGGNAELELVDSMDPFSEGIIFSVMPPKKSWKNISNLSGGEKTLSSLALVFALHVFKPTPLYFMDEIDAALDFRNVSIVANYIKDRTKNAQFIIISLRNDMFELSHRLIGIYKTSNATRSISINNHALQAIPMNSVPA